MSAESSEDSYVRENAPTQNNGLSPLMSVNGNADNIDRLLVKFDVSSIPSGATVTQATLTLCAPTNPPVNSQGRTHELRLATSSWTETGVTWNSQPAVSAVSGTLTVPTTASCLTVDVAADVQSWVDGAANYGWRLSDQDEASPTGTLVNYGTRDGAAGDRPTLDVTYTP